MNSSSWYGGGGDGGTSCCRGAGVAGNGCGGRSSGESAADGDAIVTATAVLSRSSMTATVAVVLVVVVVSAAGSTFAVTGVAVRSLPPDTTSCNHPRTRFRYPVKAANMLSSLGTWPRGHTVHSYHHRHLWCRHRDTFESSVAIRCRPDETRFNLKKRVQT